MKAPLSLALVLLAVSALGGARAALSCKSAASMTIPYDLSRYVLPSSGAYTYVTMSGSGLITVESTITFGICSNVDPPQSECEETQDWNLNKMTGPAGVFQIMKATGKCLRLAGDIEAEGQMTMNMQDQTDPSKGVVLHYYNGNEKCNISGVDPCPADHILTRRFNINFMCYATVEPVPSSGALRYSSDGAGSTLSFYTAAGCPTTCPIVNGLLCNGHGSCGLDSDYNTVHCYCNIGYGGKNCEKAVKLPFTAPTAVFLGLSCVMLIAIVGFVIYVFLKLRKININPDAYATLERKFNELGQLTS